MFKLLMVAVAAILISAPSTANENRCCYDKSLYSQLNYAGTRLMGQFLYHQAINNPYQTFATSPLSALIIGGEMGLHTEGDSYKEILNLINLDDKCQIKDVFEYAMPIYTCHLTKDVKSTLKPKIYGDDSISFRQAFTKEFREIFDGDTENIDARRADRAAEKINEWANSQSSNNETEDIISACEIHEDYGLYVISTHELIVDWDNPFNPQGITEIDFRVNNSQGITMPSLYGDGYLNYANYTELDAQLLELPLKGGNLSVFILFPNQVEGLPILLKQLRDPEVFNKAYNSMQPRCINVNVPLGEVHSTVDIKDNLIAANYPSLFDPKTAKLKGISKNNDDGLYISQFRHAISLIGNSEIGNSTNLSGPTDPSSDVCYGQDDRPYMKCDHPFAYCIIGKFITTLICGLYYGNT